MTLDGAIKHAETVAEEHTKYNIYGGFESCDECATDHRQLAEWLKELKRLKDQEPCEDAVSRQAVLDLAKKGVLVSNGNFGSVCKAINEIPSVNPLAKDYNTIHYTPQPKTGHCKDCKHFEYDKVAKVDGIPLIVAHEICNKWGDGCKTKEDGYCFLFEPQESEGKE